MTASNEASKTRNHPARRRSEPEGAHPQSTAPQESLASTPVLPIHQTPIELPLDELSEKAISALLRSAGTAGKQAACLWFRIGKYRVTEEIHGRKVARELIRDIEIRLRDCLREDDVLCQVSASEFAIVLYDVNNTEDVAAIAERVLEQGGGVYENGDLRLHVTASVGIARYPTDATRPHDLLRYARMALRDINPQDPSHYRVFSTGLLSRLRDSAWTVTEIERALEQGRMVLHYQPQYAIDTQRVVGVEALVRLQTESGELLGPNHFIELAEQTGQILELGRWVLEQACQQLARWRQAGAGSIRMAVNVSPAQLMSSGFCEVVDTAVSRAGIRHTDLELEITERQVVEHLPQVEQTLRDLTAKGVRVAIDDFGTGYSSLAYLMQMSIHTVKVDRAFMSQIPADGRAGRVVRLIIDMAREMGLTLTAEGIETEEQHQFLLDSGCALGQGFNFARPQAAEAIQRYLL